MKKMTVLVDAGYFYSACSLNLLQSSCSRKNLEINISAFFNFIKSFCQKEFDSELFRVHWYDGVIPTGLSVEQQKIATTPNILFRKGFINEKGEQKCIDTKIVADMLDFAYLKTTDEILLVGADTDLLIGVEKAQQLGLKVHLLTLSNICVSQKLKEHVDSVHSIEEEYTNQFIKFIELPIDNINLEECEDVATAYIDTLEADHLFALKAEIISSNKIPKNDDIALLKMGRLYFKRNLHSEEKHMIRDKLKQKLS